MVGVCERNAWQGSTGLHVLCNLTRPASDLACAAEVANLQSWLLAHVAWLDGAFDMAAAPAAAGAGNATAPAVRAASSLP